MESQANYARFGACEERFIENVRLPEATELRDAEWRPVQGSDLSHLRASRKLSRDECHQLETWYYRKNAHS